MSLPIRALIGNPSLDDVENRDALYEECGMSPVGLPDSPEMERRMVEREMAEAFGWDAEESPEEAEAHHQSYLRSQAADAADDAAAESEVMARWPGLLAKSDTFLIDLIGNPPALMADADEAAAAAAIILAARLDGRLPRVA